jgi:hypothetical protein
MQIYRYKLEKFKLFKTIYSPESMYWEAYKKLKTNDKKETFDKHVQQFRNTDVETYLSHEKIGEWFELNLRKLKYDNFKPLDKENMDWIKKQMLYAKNLPKRIL